jgi:hypothetical protein
MEGTVNASGAERGPYFDVVGHIQNWVLGPDGLVQRNWDMGGWPKPWHALAPSTVADKMRKGFNPTADQTRSGKLELDARDPGIKTSNETELRLAIPSGQNEYAAAHQYGVSKFKSAPHGKALKHKQSRDRFGRQGTSIMPARPPYQSPTPAECQKEAAALAHGILKEAGFE